MNLSLLIQFLAQIWAVFIKELQLLRRDRGGLAVMFVMPVVLVVIVCLVQDNILKVSGATTVKLLLVDHDQGALGQTLLHQLEEGDSFAVTHVENEIDYPKAQHDVADGLWQVGVYLPAGVSEELKRRAFAQIKQGFFESSKQKLPSPILTIEYFFDPAVQGGLQAGIRGLLHQLVMSEALKLKMDAFQTLLPAQLERHISAELGPMFAQVLAQNPLKINLPDSDEPLLQAVLAYDDDTFIMPTSVQHNVPAWTLFGIFFIILPLSGVLLQERSHGVLPRLLLAPGQRAGLLLGRLLAYLTLCMVQFGIMAAVGFYVLPRLGTDILQINGQGGALLVVALCAGLTACGFGLLLGVIACSEQQAIMTAAVTIVIAAALGGIMVPVYMMPAAMQNLSVISPLGWGLDACQVLLLRGGTLSDIVPHLTTMLGCFTICLLISWRKLRHLNG